MNLILKLLLNSISLLIVAQLIDGISFRNYGAAFFAAVILALVNTFIRPIFVFFTLPLSFFTLGLFIFIINGLMLYLTSFLVKGFVIEGFGAALVGAILTSLVSWLLQMIIRD